MECPVIHGNVIWPLSGKTSWPGNGAADKIRFVTFGPSWTPLIQSITGPSPGLQGDLAGAGTWRVSNGNQGSFPSEKVKEILGTEEAALRKRQLFKRSGDTQSGQGTAYDPVDIHHLAPLRSPALRGT